MSIQSVSSQVQDLEQYKIRKQTEAQKAEQAVSEQSFEELVQVDEYDKANPVGAEVEGIYSVSHDEEGNLKVEYKQPVSKSDSSSESKSDVKADAKSEAKNEGAGGAGQASGGNSVSSSSSSSDDDELEKLKKQRDQLKAQINREADESVKQQLRQQLQSVEVQIALKSAGSAS